MDRIEETGHHIKGTGIAEAPRIRAEVVCQQMQDIAAMPEEAAIAQRFISGMQFDAVRDMYRRINAKSQGRRTKALGRRTGLLSPHENMSAPTNDIDAGDFFLVIMREEDGTPKNQPGMQYSDVPNLIRVNLKNPIFVELAELERKTTLTKSETAKKFFLVINAYQLIFHELGHAYGYRFNNNYDAPGGIHYHRAQSGIQRIKSITTPIAGTNFSETRKTLNGIFWLEGWNDLQASLRMEDYLQSHSLVFGDVVLTKDTFATHEIASGMFGPSPYGHASLAIYAIARKIAKGAGTNMDGVLDAFTRVFQTKRGRDDLYEVLDQIFDPAFTNKIMKSGIYSMESKVLAAEIMEKVEAPAPWQEHLLDIITTPDRD